MNERLSITEYDPVPVPTTTTPGGELPNAMVVKWKPEDWKWLLIYKQLAKESPEIYKPIYKNYLRWYARSN